MPGLSPIARACRRGASPQSAGLGRARTRAPDDALQKGTGRARSALRCSVAIDGKRVERAHRVPALERPSSSWTAPLPHCAPDEEIERVVAGQAGVAGQEPGQGQALGAGEERVVALDRLGDDFGLRVGASSHSS